MRFDGHELLRARKKSCNLSRGIVGKQGTSRTVRARQDIHLPFCTEETRCACLLHRTVMLQGTGCPTCSPDLTRHQLQRNCAIPHSCTAGSLSAPFMHLSLGKNASSFACIELGRYDGESVTFGIPFSYHLAKRHSPAEVELMYDECSEETPADWAPSR